MKSATKGRTPIGEISVSTVALRRYVVHLRKRLDRNDTRPIKVRENERKRLHDAVIDSAEPSGLSKCQLEAYIEKTFFHGSNVSFFIGYRELEV